VFWWRNRAVKIREGKIDSHPENRLCSLDIVTEMRQDDKSGHVSRCDFIVKAAETSANVCGIDIDRNRENVHALEKKSQSLLCKRLLHLS
jgi:hypothetical protein